MNFQIKRLVYIGAGILILPCNIYASGLVYNPQNTAFGGTNANAPQILMSKAQAQNETKDPNTKTPGSQQTAIERFQANLERRILDKIAREIVSGAFEGEGGDETGTFSTDDFSVTVNDENPDAVSVTIVEYATGSSTSIEVPKF
jgi:curli production assembly/transport component CsgF